MDSHRCISQLRMQIKWKLQEWLDIFLWKELKLILGIIKESYQWIMLKMLESKFLLWDEFSLDHIILHSLQQRPLSKLKKEYREAWIAGECFDIAEHRMWQSLVLKQVRIIAVCVIIKELYHSFFFLLIDIP